MLYDQLKQEQEYEEYSSAAWVNLDDVQFIDEYEEELLNIHKRNIATKAKEKLMKIYYKSNKALISDAYIYEHIELDDDLKPYLNLKTPPPKK